MKYLFYTADPLANGMLLAYHSFMRKTKSISSSMHILGGTSVFSGTRVPVQTLFDYLEEGKSIHSFLADFPSVSPLHVAGALHAIKKMLRSKKHARAA